MSLPASEQPVGDPVDARPAPRPERTTLRGRHVSIVPFDAAVHAAPLFAAIAGAENDGLWTYLAQGPFADAGSFAAFYAAAAQKDDPLLFALVDPDGRTLGHACLMRIDAANRVIEIGNILYAPALQRTPAATEAMALFARHVFDDLGYRRYEWKCNALNAPSRRAAARLGFTYEGIFRAHMIIKGRNRDTAWFSLLDSEWPRARAAFDAWLDPANFDAEGRQRRSLEAIRAAL